MYISDSIKYAGVADSTIDLFESQYPVPEGVTYNSYVLLDEKTVILDTADKRAVDTWIENIKKILGDKTPDYLVISHLEPDHSAGIIKLHEIYPDMKLIGNAKTFSMLPQFIDEDLSGLFVTVAENDTISMGEHNLKFIMAPMVHWPEVMVTYDEKDKVLFSADGFGKFGTTESTDDWACEARRYYFNIVGKYGKQVQALLKKLAPFDIQTIAPLHGPVLSEDLGYYIGLYDTWSSYKAEDKGVLVAYASIHGNTAKAAGYMADLLENEGQKVVLTDLSRADVAEVVEDAFRYDRMVLAASSYDAGVFPPMEEFLRHLISKNFCNRTAAVIENGSWGPTAARKMNELLAQMKDVNVLEEVVTIKTTMNEQNKLDMKKMAEKLAKM